MDESQFKHQLMEYVRLNDTIAAIRKRLAEANRTKLNMVYDLLSYMRFHDLDEVRLESLGGRVIVFESKRTEGLKRHHIEQHILPLVDNDQDRCKEIIDKIYASRNVTREPSLSRRKK